ncbi:MAG: SpoIIE family protein phosphatase [Acutalibacteraceae bacterium]
MTLKEFVSKQEESTSEKREKDEIRRLKTALKMFLAAVIGFCFSQLDCLGELSPFSYGFLGAVPFQFCFAVFSGSTVGYLIGFAKFVTLRQILCLFIISMVRLVASKKFPDIENGRFNVILVFFSAFVSHFVTGISFLSVLTAVLESSLACCSCYFFLRAFKTPLMRIGISNLSALDSFSLIISLCSFLMSFSGTEIEGFSPARLCSVFALCLCCYCKGPSAGAIAGICLGAAVSVKPEASFIFPAFSLSGLLGGAFYSLGQPVIGAVCCLCFCAVCLISGQGQALLLPIIECVIACAAFMLLPTGWLYNIKASVNKVVQVSDDDVNLRVSALLQKASSNIYSFCETVSGVSGKLDKIIKPEVNKLFFELQQKICDGCSQKSFCWSKNFDSTAFDVLVILGTHKRQKSKLSLEKRCSRLPELKRYIIASRNEYSLNMVAKMKNREMRKLLTEQFSTMGDFLKELSGQIANSRSLDSAKSSALRGAIIDSGMYIDALNCLGGKETGLLIEVTSLEKPFETDYKRIKTTLEDMTGRAFNEPDIFDGEMGTVLKFEEKSALELIIGCFQRPLVKGGPCGDSVSLDCSFEGKQYVILSDGMGTGAAASLDSTMTVSLLEKLLSCGFSFESAVKIVNSSLIMKSTDESMATVDGLCVNLFTGKGEFYKAGATISFLRRGNIVYTIEESSLPLGILREISYNRISKQFEVGDILLILSDGITAGDCGWISDELLSWSTNSMEDLALHIVELAALRQDSCTGDDLTAVAVKIARRGD